MKLPLNASQSIAVVAVAAALLGGAYALGRVGSPAGEPAAPPADEIAVAAADTRPAAAVHKPQQQAQAQPKPSKPALCDECSRITAVRTEEREGQASGLGAVGGAVIGGLLGNQVGGGNGKKIATVGGAVAGGYAGNEVEKRSRSSRVWIVSLTDSDGRTHKHEQASDPQLHAGDIVVVRVGRLERR
jgi:uncharacterized protein YcfJ